LFAYEDPRISLICDAEVKMSVSSFLPCLFMNEDIVEKRSAQTLGFIVIRNAKAASEKLESENLSMYFGATLSCV